MTGMRRPPPWWLAFLGFFLLIAGWATAAPYDGAPDEMPHVIRAAGVAAGQLAPPPVNAINGGGAYQTVPGSLVREQCWQRDVRKSAACAVPVGGDNTAVRVATSAGRYYPPYYVAVGWPLNIWPDMLGLLLARLVSGAMCAAFLASALINALRWGRHKLMAVGMLAAVTPMAVHMAAAINPSGLEICAGIALFAAVIPLFLRDPPLNRSLLTQVGIAAATLASLRQLGPIFVLVALAAVLIPARRSMLGELWRSATARVWAAIFVVASIAMAVWTVVMKTADAAFGNQTEHWPVGRAALREMDEWRYHADELVGVMGYLTVSLPAPAYLAWQYAVAGLLLWAFASGTGVDRWRMAVIAIGGVGIPFAIQIMTVNTYGFVTQGRYFLPVLSGLVLLAGFILGGTDQVTEKASRVVLRLFMIITFSVHFVALVYTMVHWQNGLERWGPVRNLNPLAGDWHPVVGSLPPLLMAITGLMLVFYVIKMAPQADYPAIRRAPLVIARQREPFPSASSESRATVGRPPRPQVP